jgi:putative transposase
MENENISVKVKKIKLIPTTNQKKILERWAGTTRYVYNKCLDKIKKDSSLNSSKGYAKLKKECITAKDNNIIKTKEEEKGLEKFLYNWEIGVPKDIRNGALRDIKKAYQTAFANIKVGNINHFGLNFRKKKQCNDQSMEIPHSAIKIKGNTVLIYQQYIKDPIKIHKDSLKGFDKLEINKYCRLKRENNEWILWAPYETKIKNKPKEGTCAIDPGIRKFITVYAENQMVQIIPNHKTLKNIYKKLDLIKSLRDKKEITKQSFNKSRCHLQRKLKNLINELHYKSENS